MEDEVVLITKTTGQDEDGFEANKVKRTEIFGEVRETTRNEYYKALAEGIRAVKAVRVHKDDYEDAIILSNEKSVCPEEAKINGTTYRIERAYSVEDDIVELTCSEV